MKIKSSKRYRSSLVPVTSYLSLVPVTSYLLLVPVLLSAQQSIKIFDTPASGLNFTTFSNKLSDIANTIIPFLVGVAFVVVMWGVFKYVRSAGDAEKLSEGRKVALYGVIAIFMMLSFWGFVMIIKKSLFG